MCAIIEYVVIAKWQSKIDIDENYLNVTYWDSVNLNKFEWVLNDIRIEKTIFFLGFNSTSCNLLQYQGKLMMQPWKNDKNTHFGPNFFSWILPLLVVRHCSKLSSYAIWRKTNERNLRKWQKTNFGPDFGLFDPNLSPPPFFFFANFSFTSS